MDPVTVVGLIAGGLTTVSLLPQVTQIWRTKSARDISLKMFVAFCGGVFLWLVYGILLRETPIILWNGITLALGLANCGDENRVRLIGTAVRPRFTRTAAGWGAWQARRTPDCGARATR